MGWVAQMSVGIPVTGRNKGSSEEEWERLCWGSGLETDQEEVSGVSEKFAN